MSQCRDTPDVEKLHSQLSRTITNTSKKSKIIGKFGNIKLRENELSYAVSLNKVKTINSLKQNSKSVRKLYIKKALLRKMIIQKGFSQNVYDSPEAAAFILPRLEKILEDYYFQKAGNFKGLERKIGAISPDDRVINDFLQKKSALKGRNLKKIDIKRAQKRIQDRLIEMRKADARSKMIKALLGSNPSIEVYQ